MVKDRPSGLVSARTSTSLRYHLSFPSSPLPITLLIDPSNLSCNPNVVRLQLGYGLQACSLNLLADINHLERIQTLATGHYEAKFQLLGLHSLQRRRVWADLMKTFRIFISPLDADPIMFFSTTHSTRYKRCKLQGAARGSLNIRISFLLFRRYGFL